MSANSLSKEEILDFLRKNKPFFKKKFGIEGVKLFGSFARDEATPESDVDILIDMKKKDFDKWFDFKDLLEKEFNRKVDVLFRDSVRTFIMRFIKKEMIDA